MKSKRIYEEQADIGKGIRGLQACKSTLVVTKLDRLSRNVANVAGFLDADIEFWAVDAPFTNRFVVHVQAAVSEYEQDQISART